MLEPPEQHEVDHAGGRHIEGGGAPQCGETLGLQGPGAQGYAPTERQHKRREGVALDGKLKKLTTLKPSRSSPRLSWAARAAKVRAAKNSRERPTLRVRLRGAAGSLAATSVDHRARGGSDRRDRRAQCPAALHIGDLYPAGHHIDDLYLTIFSYTSLPKEANGLGSYTDCLIHLLLCPKGDYEKGRRRRCDEPHLRRPEA